MSPHSMYRLLAAIMLTAPSPLLAQTTINVDAGETLSQSDLASGSFNGTPFTLGPDLTININSGATFRGVTTRGSGFDVLGTTVNFRDGALFQDFPRLRNGRFLFEPDVGSSKGLLMDGDVTILGGHYQAQVNGFEVTPILRGNVSISDGRFSLQTRLNGVTMSGGSFGELLDVLGPLILRGNEFEIDGEPVGPGPIEFGWDVTKNMPVGGVLLTGTLENGDTFSIANTSGGLIERNSLPGLSSDVRMVDEVLPNSITIEHTTVPAPRPFLLLESGVLDRQGVRAGEAILLRGDATYLEPFDVIGGALFLDSTGALGNGLTVSNGGLVEMRSGEIIGNGLDPLRGQGPSAIHAGGLFRNEGGLITEELWAFNGARFEQTGGRISNYVGLFGSTALVKGGLFSGTIGQGLPTNLQGLPDPILEVRGGQASFLELFGGATHISGAAEMFAARSENDAIVTVTGGYLRAMSFPEIAPDGGFSEPLYINNVFPSLQALDESTLFLAGGEIEYLSLRGDGARRVVISGTTFRGKDYDLLIRPTPAYLLEANTITEIYGMVLERHPITNRLYDFAGTNDYNLARAPTTPAVVIDPTGMEFRLYVRELFVNGLPTLFSFFPDETISANTDDYASNTHFTGTWADGSPIDLIVNSDSGIPAGVPITLKRLGDPCNSMADLNGDRALNEIDTLQLIQLLSRDNANCNGPGSPTPCSDADVNADGSADFFDMIDHLRAFDAGCD